MTTLLATDIATGSSVVLKTASAAAFSAATLARLEQEARALQGLHSPRLAPPLDVGIDAHLFYLTTPVVPGVTLQARLADGPLSVPEVVLVGRCLAEGLTKAHDAGVLHRGVKPGNVIVGSERPLSSAVLIDFGITRSCCLSPSIPTQIVQDVHYISPEQAGLLHHDVDERSDLYSLGVLLFECLAGRTPFDGTTLGHLLRQHLCSAPPTLRSQGLTLPRALDEVIQRLLRKDPSERYQSASALLGDLDELAEHLTRGLADPAIVVGTGDRRARFAQPVFVGRAAELAALARQLERATLGCGQLVLLEAEAGGGKTRVLDEIEQLAAQRGIRVLRGGAVGQTAIGPLQLLTGVVTAIVAAAESDGNLTDTLRRRIGPRETLAGMLPELQEVLGVRAVEHTGSNTYAEHRALEAMASLLDAVGSAEHPALVLLDDCQWADELTTKLLRCWQEAGAEPSRDPRHVVVIASFRSEEVGDDHPLRQGHVGAHLRLPPLGDDHVWQMAESMAGPLPAPARELISQLAKGNPFFVSAVMHGLLESGALVQTLSSGWRLRDDSMAAPQASRQAAILLARRLDFLPADTLALLSAGAVLGREFDLALAATLAEQTPERALRSIDEPSRRHLVWVTSTTCTFVHDLVREAFLDRLDVVERARLHRRAAEELERAERERPYELAYHFDAAGEHNRALPYALAAADAARTRHALEAAEAQYRIAERGVDGAEPTVRGRVAEGLGQVLMLRGRYEEAARQLILARSLAKEAVTHARIEGQLAELAFKRGDVPEASRGVEEALRILGKRLPRWSIAVLVFLTWEVVVQLVHRLIWWRRTGPRRPKAAERDLLAARLYSQVLYAWWFSHSAPAVCWASFRLLNRAERCLPSRELGHACSTHAASLTAVVPLFHRRGEAVAARALRIHEALDDTWGRGQALSFSAAVSHAAGRFSEGIERCDGAAVLLERLGDPWELTTALWHRALCLYRLGDLSGAIEQSRHLHGTATDLGDAQATAIALEIWSKASRGRVPEDVVDSALIHARGDVQATIAALQAKAIRLLGAGLSEEAAEVLEDAERLFDDSGVRNVYVCSLLSWLTTARRQAAQGASPLTPHRQRRRLQRRARRAARRGLRYARVYPNDLPHALREAGLVAALSGRARRARRFLDRSLAEADSQGALAEQGETLRARGEVGAALGWKDSSRDLLRGQEALRDLETHPDTDDTPLEAATPALAARFDALLDAGRRIVSATSADQVRDAIAETALNLLPAEECRVFNMVDGPTQTGEEHDASPRCGRTLAQEPSARRQPVVLSDTITRGCSLSDNCPAVGARSALCTPIIVSGQIQQCFVVTHRQVADAFGEEQERLTAFVATLGGAAVERARLQQETRRQVITAQEAERARLARDLHDEIGQALTSILLSLRLHQSGLNAVHPEDEAAQERVMEMRDMTSQALRQVRQLAFELRPTVLDDLGLTAALRRLTSDVASRHGIKADLAIEVVSDGHRLRPEVETAVYRVVQEAITNIVRHAEASGISVLVAGDEDRLRVVVEDDGSGFEPQAPPHASLGLRGMAERADLVGGCLAITSTPGEGTSVILDVPLV